MNKDTIIASVVGFGLGLIAAIGLWVVPKFLPKKAENALTQTKTEVVASPNSTPEATADFMIESPTDGSMTDKKTVEVKGVAKDAQLVIVSTATDSKTVTPDTTGAFSAQLNLIDGGNDIIVSKYSKDNQETKTLVVYEFSESI